MHTPGEFFAAFEEAAQNDPGAFRVHAKGSPYNLRTMVDLSFHRSLVVVTLLTLAGCSESNGGSGPAGPSGSLPALQAVPDAVGGGRIVDASGREVLLRGVNVNALVEYWQYSEELFTTYAFTEEDADAAGDDAPAGNQLEAFVPTNDPSSVQVELAGLDALDSMPWFGGTLFHARAVGGPWSIRITR